MIELKPCPFCPDGGRPEMLHSFFSRCDSSGTAFHGHCAECGASGPIRDTPEEAAEAWNTRQAPEPPTHESDVAYCPRCFGDRFWRLPEKDADGYSLHRCADCGGDYRWKKPTKEKR